MVQRCDGEVFSALVSVGLQCTDHDARVGAERHGYEAVRTFVVGDRTRAASSTLYAAPSYNGIRYSKRVKLRHLPPWPALQPSHVEGCSKWLQQVCVIAVHHPRRTFVGCVPSPTAHSADMEADLLRDTKVFQIPTESCATGRALTFLFHRTTPSRTPKRVHSIRRTLLHPSLLSSSRSLLLSSSPLCAEICFEIWSFDTEWASCASSVAIGCGPCAVPLGRWADGFASSCQSGRAAKQSFADSDSSRMQATVSTRFVFIPRI